MSWEEAVNRFQQAVDEWDKRQAALALGAAIGAALGQSTVYINRRTPEQIEAMSEPDMDAWVAQVELNPPPVG